MNHNNIMVYIYKKTIGNKEYYYLRASQRKQGKVLAKDIAYLGSSLKEVKYNLANLPKYSEQIRKAYKTINNFLESNHYLEKVKTALNQLPQRIKFLQEKKKEIIKYYIYFLIFSKLFLYIFSL